MGEEEAVRVRVEDVDVDEEEEEEEGEGEGGRADGPSDNGGISTALEPC